MIICHTITFFLFSGMLQKAHTSECLGFFAVLSKRKKKKKTFVVLLISSYM